MGAALRNVGGVGGAYLVNPVRLPLWSLRGRCAWLSRRCRYAPFAGTSAVVAAAFNCSVRVSVVASRSLRLALPTRVAEREPVRNAGRGVCGATLKR